jgi:hypothetical protein
MIMNLKEDELVVALRETNDENSISTIHCNHDKKNDANLKDFGNSIWSYCDWHF